MCNARCVCSYSNFSCYPAIDEIDQSLFHFRVATHTFTFLSSLPGFKFSGFFTMTLISSFQCIGYCIVSNREVVNFRGSRNLQQSWHNFEGDILTYIWVWPLMYRFWSSHFHIATPCMLGTIFKQCRRPYVIRVPTFFPLSYCQCQVKRSTKYNCAYFSPFFVMGWSCKWNWGPNVN